MRAAWILMASLIWLHTAIVNADETAEIVEIEKSKKVYFSALEKAGDELLVNIEKQLISLSKLGKLDAITEVEMERDRFRADRELPKSVYLKNPRAQYDKSLKLAETTLSRAYEKAIVSLTKRREIETARSLKAEREELLAGKLVDGLSAFRVVARAEWQPSQINVTAGVVYRICSKGSWRGSSAAMTGPNGILSKPYHEAMHDTLHLKDRSKYLGLHPVNSLIAKIGTESWSFFVGEQCQFLSPRSGVLSFGLNDDKEGAIPGEGSVQVVVKELKDFRWNVDKVQITGLIDSFDDLFITKKGIYWRHDAPWDRVGQQLTTFPTIINGVFWFPDWTKGIDEKSSALLVTSDFGIDSSRTISDFKFKATLPDGKAAITSSSATETVIRIEKGNGIGAFPVTVTWEYRPHSANQNR